MELLNLQSSLQSEIQAKQAINEELSSTRSELIAAQKYVPKYLVLAFFIFPGITQPFTLIYPLILAISSVLN